MTERLYYTSDDTRGHATITHCTAEPDGRYAITLDSTLFHPQGGGQPSDSGAIGGVPVEGVMTRGEEVVHIVAQPLPPGETTLHIDAAVRHLHARLHSAGHMIGQAGEIFGWRPVKAHHWPNEGRITFAIGEGSTLPEAAQLMAKLANGRPTILRAELLLTAAYAVSVLVTYRDIPVAVRTWPVYPSWVR